MDLPPGLPIEIVKLAQQRSIAKGDRTSTLREIAFSLAKAGATNNEICNALSVCADRWGTWPNNAYQKWKWILKLIQEIREAGYDARP